MGYHEFRFLINQTSQDIIDNLVEKPNQSIGCALISGWTDKQQSLSEVKKTICQVFQAWFATKDGKEYLEENDSIINYNIVDLAEAMDSSVRVIMSEHEINDLKVEIFNTEEEWKLDDILAVIPQVSHC